MEFRILSGVHGTEGRADNNDRYPDRRTRDTVFHRLSVEDSKFIRFDPERPSLILSHSVRMPDRSTVPADREKLSHSDSFGFFYHEYYSIA